MSSEASYRFVGHEFRASLPDPASPWPCVGGPRPVSPSGVRRPLLCLLGVGCITSCGYRLGYGPQRGGRPLRIYVAEVKAPDIDVDAGGLLMQSVGRAVAHRVGMELASRDRSEWTLEVELVRLSLGLDAFAEPPVRAAGYEVVAELRARLIDHDGRVRWRSPAMVGRSKFVSPAGRLEALDGASRRAKARAIEQAAQRLLTSLGLTLRDYPPG